MKRFRKIKLWNPQIIKSALELYETRKRAIRTTPISENFRRLRYHDIRANISNILLPRSISRSRRSPDSHRVYTPSPSQTSIPIRSSRTRRLGLIQHALTIKLPPHRGAIFCSCMRHRRNRLRINRFIVATPRRCIRRVPVRTFEVGLPTCDLVYDAPLMRCTVRSGMRDFVDVWSEFKFGSDITRFVSAYKALQSMISLLNSCAWGY